MDGWALLEVKVGVGGDDQHQLFQFDDSESWVAVDANCDGSTSDHGVNVPDPDALRAAEQRRRSEKVIEDMAEHDKHFAKKLAKQKLLAAKIEQCRLEQQQRASWATRKVADTTPTPFPSPLSASDRRRIAEHLEL
eukprot:COSAG04_NODE_1601_length_6193_cov_7.603709_4_plen_136_part_00